MAVPAPNGQNGNSVGEMPTMEMVREAAAKLYGRGFTRPQIARALQLHLTSSGDVKQARQKLRKWEHQQEFRDLIWKHAVIKTDLAGPKILEGVVGQAKRGRVDAAKFALSLAGRYQERSDVPTEVTIKLDGFVRPEHRQLSGRAALPPGPTTEMDHEDK